MENHSTACQEGGKKPSSLTSLVRLSLVFCHPWSWHPIVEKVLETLILLHWTRSKRSSNKFRETLRWLIKRKWGAASFGQNDWWAQEQTIAFVGWWFKRVCWIFSTYNCLTMVAAQHESAVMFHSLTWDECYSLWPKLSSLFLAHPSHALEISGAGPGAVSYTHLTLPTILLV